MWNRRHRWIRRFAAGLAFAALVVPTAQAGIVEDSGVGIAYNGYGYHQSPGVPESQQLGTRVLPDDRAVRVSHVAQDTRVMPDDRAVRFSPEPGQPQLVATSSNDFSWGDAGIGAGLALGAMLLGLGALVATRHASRKSLATA